MGAKEKARKREEKKRLTQKMVIRRRGWLPFVVSPRTGGRIRLP